MTVPVNAVRAAVECGIHDVILLQICVIPQHILNARWESMCSIFIQRLYCLGIWVLTSMQCLAIYLRIGDDVELL